MLSRDFADMMECSSKLYDAVLENDVELTEALLQSHSCDVNEADERNGRTALHLAALRGNAELASVLLSEGADVNACDNQGNTPMHWCGHIETMELLAEHGAKFFQRNKRGFTPRDLAQRRGVSEMAYNLLCRLEKDSKEREEQECTESTTSLSGTRARFSTSLPNKKQLKASIGQPLFGLWHEVASELGGRNSLLLVLGLLGFSLYMAYILTGLHFSGHNRIPIDSKGDSFKVRV